MSRGRPRKRTLLSILLLVVLLLLGFLGWTQPACARSLGFVARGELRIERR